MHDESQRNGQERPLVLVVDDEPDILMVMETALEIEGYRIALAEHGRSALNQVDEIHPDVVLLDIMMPVLDGWAVLGTLATLPKPPVTIVVSARTRPEDMALAYRLGADGYVTKPFDFDGLVRAIRESMARSGPERARYRDKALADLRDSLVNPS